jgi:hypothetical protein
MKKKKDRTFLVFGILGTAAAATYIVMKYSEAKKLFNVDISIAKNPFKLVAVDNKIVKGMLNLIDGESIENQYQPE